jgi:hypothetical protein
MLSTPSTELQQRPPSCDATGCRSASADRPTIPPPRGTDPRAPGRCPAPSATFGRDGWIQRGIAHQTGIHSGERCSRRTGPNRCHTAPSAASAATAVHGGESVALRYQCTPSLPRRPQRRIRRSAAPVRSVSASLHANILTGANAATHYLRAGVLPHAGALPSMPSTKLQQCRRTLASVHTPSTPLVHVFSSGSWHHVFVQCHAPVMLADTVTSCSSGSSHRVS